MSDSSWIKWKKKTRERLEAQGKSARIAVLGIGNEFNGDDAAGTLAARSLQQKLGDTFRREGREHETKSSSFLSAEVLVIDAGLAPENYSGNLRCFKPTLLLLIDAADLSEPPGKLRVLDWQSVSGFSASTHLQPLSTLGEYLVVELGCELALVGIQPAQNQFDQPISAPVINTVNVLVEDLYKLLVGRVRQGKDGPP